MENIDSDISINNVEYGTFINFKSPQKSSELAFDFGILPNIKKLTGCYRFNACWMQPFFGNKMSDIMFETQFLMAMLSNDNYIIIIPLLDSRFRCSLDSKDNKLILIAETGSTIETGDIVCGAYVCCSNDPILAIKHAMNEIKQKLGTFKLREEKATPEFVDYFGFCTYNAFYREYTHDKIISLLENYSNNDVIPKFILIDDGWQQTNGKYLTSLEVNKDKFPQGISSFTRELRDRFDIKQIFGWIAYNGFWEGVKSAEFEEFLPLVHTGFVPIRLHKYCYDVDNQGEATAGMTFIKKECIENDNFLILDKLNEFYFKYFTYLKNEGINGIKIDAMAWIEMYGEHIGGRVFAMKKLLDAAKVSTCSAFNGALLNCSCNSNDYYFNAEFSNVTRTSTDFYPLKPETNGTHILTNAHVSTWIGEIVLPDWDMFQTGIYGGEFHAAARAISGGPVYSTDEIGKENFNIMKKLSLSDGKLARCINPAILTKDSLFINPNKDNAVIKIQNQNVYNHVVGCFNCNYNSENAEGCVSIQDIWNLPSGDYGMFSYKEQKFVENKFIINLNKISFEICTIFDKKSGFAPVGLKEKYNIGATFTELEERDSYCEFKVLDSGEFICYSNNMPISICENNEEIIFNYDNKCVGFTITNPNSKIRVVFR